MERGNSVGTNNVNNLTPRTRYSMSLTSPGPKRYDPMVCNTNSLESSHKIGNGQPVTRTLSQIENMLDENNTVLIFESESQFNDSFKALFSFYQSGILCDVKIIVGAFSIPCHRVVLACVSDYFKTMFTADMAESREREIVINDIDPVSLKLLIEYAYTGRIVITTESVQLLLYASSILSVESVARICCEFMKSHLHPHNCIGVRAFAASHARIDLMNKADLYAIDHFTAVIEGDEFVSASLDNLEVLISSSDLNVPSEVIVFESVMKWVKHDIESRKQHLPSLLTKVLLCLLPVNYLVESVSREELIRCDLQCRDLVDEAKHYQLSQARVVLTHKSYEHVQPRKSYSGCLKIVIS